MNDAAIKSFCTWARRELISQVRIQAMRFGIRDDGYAPASEAVIDGVPLTDAQMRQRADLISRLGTPDSESYTQSYERLIDAAAYTWFNRLVAIRYMEVNDRLPSHVRALSGSDGTFAPQMVREALDVAIEGIDPAQVSALVAASDDEALFRYMFLAQCAELASCMPEVFEPVGASLELLLPEGLLRPGGVVKRLVTDIPEEDWREGVQIVGWMYQYYNAELKDEVFASFKKGKKADREALKPATQLFTPDWIVRYLVENSVGRLWMQGHSGSNLPEHMPYYVPDEGEVPSNIDAPISPEDITVIDPACGSGHILVYAFELLANMYEEAGYTRRDIPRLVLERNLTGLEIDPRAAQLASFALTMTACNYDSRFLRRGVYPKVLALKSVELEEEELQLVPMLAERAKLLDAMAHMGECGSLFTPDEADMQAISDAERALEGMTDLFAAKALEKVREMRANCEPLYEKYSAVVANPPYMGSSNMDKWLANWTKKSYPDSKRDLCTCFIERGFTLAEEGGYSATVTSSTWMFISSFEALRGKLLKDRTIISMLHTNGPNNHPDVFDANAAMIVEHTVRPGYEASYFKLDKLGLSVKRGMLLEAIANPDCGWFYRRDAEAFSAIPGTPIAYWASDAMMRAFEGDLSMSDIGSIRSGLQTGNNDLFLRYWHEVPYKLIRFDASSIAETELMCEKWIPQPKGGSYRKWYGNLDYVVLFENGGRALRDYEGISIIKNPGFYFKAGFSWSHTSSAAFSARSLPTGCIFNVEAPSFFPDYGAECLYELSFANSVVFDRLFGLISQTMHFMAGDVSKIPIAYQCGKREVISDIALENIGIAEADWNSFETSWDFRKSPLV